MTIRDNLKLWQLNVTYLDEDGNFTKQRLSRQVPESPLVIVRSLSRKGSLLFFVGL